MCIHIQYVQPFLRNKGIRQIILRMRFGADATAVEGCRGVPDQRRRRKEQRMHRGERSHVEATIFCLQWEFTVPPAGIMC